MNPSFTLHNFSASEILANLDALAEVLSHCVHGGASVSFMLPFSTESALAFWRRTAESTARHERVVLVAKDAGQRIVGTVQLVIDQPENQPHRADVAKLLVHESARRKGVARALMQRLEEVAIDTHKTVLVLDTATGSGAEQFYEQCGWHKSGEIPRYALMPDGELTATSIFYKFL
ncbi:MAG: GNAT family N-acetyltransferase [Kluyvera sp.]|uniref:GNAT family N-acetyltransferase n=1 Tax=Kluyvera sp. TaxID=1538228 RepID=UPI003F36EA7B